MKKGSIRTVFKLVQQLIPFLFAVAILGYACHSHRPAKQQNSGNALGTSYTITYITDQEINYQKEIDSVFRAVNQSLSTYSPTSDISKINQGDSTLVVDQMFKDVFEISGKVHKVSQGYFDPTLGILTNVWGFGPEQPAQINSVLIDSLLTYVGWNKVQLTSDNTLKKAHPAICLDFNAVAKGYAIDRLGVLLETKGIENYIIEVGGEVLAKGKNVTAQRQWAVGIDDPQADTRRKPKLIVFLKNKALASSGNYRKFRIDPQTGEKYVHTLNPKTGYPKNSTILATSVLAHSCAVADAYATAFMVMDLEHTKQVLKNQPQLEAYMLYLDKDGNTQSFMTPGFAMLVKQ